MLTLMKRFLRPITLVGLLALLVSIPSSVRADDSTCFGTIQQFTLPLPDGSYILVSVCIPFAIPANWWLFPKPDPPDWVQFDPASIVAATNPVSTTALASIQTSLDGGATWTTSQGLTAPSITSLAKDPAITTTTLYASTAGRGVFKSLDGGRSWFASNQGLTNLNVTGVTTDPQIPGTLYAGTLGGGAFKSTDGGRSWTAINRGLTYLYVSAVLVAPWDSNTLYVGTRGGGVFKSTDGGRSWFASSRGLTNPYVTVAFHPEPKFPGWIFVATDGGGVFRSTDGGASWTEINNGLTSRAISALLAVQDPSGSCMIYAGTREGGIFRSTDGGDTWLQVNPSGSRYGTIFSFTAHPTDASTIYAATAAGALKLQFSDAM